MYDPDYEFKMSRIMVSREVFKPVLLESMTMIGLCGCWQAEVIYVHMYVYIYIYLHTYIHSIYAYVYAYENIYAHMHIRFLKFFGCTENETFLFGIVVRYHLNL